MEQERFFSAVSRCLYYAMCSIIGPEERVNIERLVRDIISSFSTDFFKDCYSGVIDSKAKFVRRAETITGLFSKPSLESIYTSFVVTSEFIKIQEIVLSGSRAEGFDFKSSDFDVMLIVEKLLRKESNTEIGGKEIRLQIEDDVNDPGFVKIKVPSELTEPWSLVCERHEGGHYLSSRKLLEHLQAILKIMKISSTVHGPCLSLELENQQENDLAIAIKQDAWPAIARGCIHRLAERRWPSNDILLEILKNGCLYVPVGFPFSPLVSIQWRMSFSIAENFLVRSMNQTQFLTYALLKMTLKEVIDTDRNIKGLLCSYFLKTAVFWEIVSSKRIWEPSNLLHCYWRCFRRILKWVDFGYCPNFFVPENNMFRSKIYGENRRMLLDCLVKLYGNGFNVLLRVPSLSSLIDLSGHHPSSKDKRVPDQFSKSAILIQLIPHLRSGELLPMGDNCLRVKQRLAKQTQCEYSTALHMLWQLTEINESCFEILTSIDQTRGNRNYRKEKELIRLLKMSSPYCIRGSLYLAYLFFMRMRYEDSIRLLQQSLIKLKDPNTIYRWEFNTTRSSREYRMIGGDLLSITYGFRNHLAAEICMNYRKCLLNLTGESNERIGDHREALSPFVFSHFLLFLCHFQKGSKPRAKSSLIDLQRSFKYLAGFTERSWDISKEILRVCQKMYDDWMPLNS
ncbi:hypothetical protein FSP39_000876 [Pinctada imbricata]|uniref:Uncharacterized protein n=1 Tax=Pinctada imbricata TaxID=66713 RepID=A0AA88YA86_PINIB|nr:hypothetical protein FSP39_000876 [Pinctada imbricata]